MFTKEKDDMKRQKSAAGFTLLELLIVVIAIAILVLIALFITS